MSEPTGKSGKRYHEQWMECSRCGFFYPFSQLRMQTGDGGNVVVCSISCFDEPSRGDYEANMEKPTEKPLTFVEDS